MRKLKNVIMISAVLTAAICLNGCSAAPAKTVLTGTESVAYLTGEVSDVTAAASTTSDVAAAENGKSVQDVFTDRDLSGDVDLSTAVAITLDGTTASAESETVGISGSTVTITAEGTYVLSGTLEDGCVVVDAGEKAKVQLVLNGVSVNAEDFASIYVISADKVFVTLADGTVNTLTNGGSFIAVDENKVDAVIFSKDDITLNGSGTLVIQSPAGSGIDGKDDVTITGGNYEITASGSAIKAKDNLDIADGEFVLNAGKDGLHAKNKDDNTLGAIYIAGGTFTITAVDDGIHATTTLQIDGGSFRITAAEGLEATLITINGGGIQIEASDDGINAAQKTTSLGTPTVEINDGEITVIMGAGDTDGIDANGDIIINGGTVSVTGNSTFDYDRSGVINGGTVYVNGQQVTTLPSQMMGGHGGMGGMNGGFGGGPGMNGQPGTDGTGSATTGFGHGGRPGMNAANDTGNSSQA